MNYVGHALVASEVFPEANDAKIFGSMAPDLVGMAGTSIVRRSEHEDLSTGVEMHFATDRIFDCNPAFTSIKSMFRPIHELYLPRGAARACADVGTEMLLDGYVLQKQNAVEVYRSAIKAAQNGLPIEQLARDPDKFRYFNDRHSEVGIPFFYQDPRFVAERLQRRLSMRKSDSLKFDESKIPIVADVFDLQQQIIGNLANLLIEQTISQLKQDSESEPINTGPVSFLLPGVAISAVKRSTEDNNYLNENELKSVGYKIPNSFATGRRAAKAALSQLGSIDFEIPKGAKGMPIFPEGYVGSISHTGEWAIAIAAGQTSYVSLGIDIESNHRVSKQNINKRITTDEELSRYWKHGENAPRVIFSLKEAVYKAVYPFVGRRFGFNEVELIPISDTMSEVRPISRDIIKELGSFTVIAAMIRDSAWQTSICFVES